MKDSAELLRLYATTGSETAFKDLVDQYLPLVYSAALRQTNGDRELAKDVAQAVFIDLARKANKLVDRELLIGWLYRGTHFAARNAMRANFRRRVREQNSSFMRELVADGALSEGTDLYAALDEAMGHLKPEDRIRCCSGFLKEKNSKRLAQLKELGKTPPGCVLTGPSPGFTLSWPLAACRLPLRDWVPYWPLRRLAGSRRAWPAVSPPLPWQKP
jgi:DNA-directed RNA polymerase specialized sigma24 family protein